jgi:hypothetical protein
VPGSAHDAYPWEVQHATDKRVPRPEYLGSEATAMHLLAGAAPVAGASATSAATAPVADAALYKVFVNRMQQGPYTVQELAQRVARGEIDGATKVWDMRWVPHVDQWKQAREVPQLAVLFAAAIPDPTDEIPDPE